MDVEFHKLRPLADRLCDWARHAALPFWLQYARDPHGGFYEELSLDGRANHGAIRRLRVQARQVYVLCQSYELGWLADNKAAEQTWDFMLSRGYKKEGKDGFIHRLNADGSVHDPRRDLYDHAFYLFACAWMIKTSPHHYVGQDKPKDILAQTLGFIDTALTSSSGGWEEGLPPSPNQPRRQNPHMHLFEAFLTLYDITKETLYLDYAHKIFALFKSHIIASESGSIREFFTSKWDIWPGETGASIEPGHIAEWIWLLGQYENLSGIQTQNYADALYTPRFTQDPIYGHDEENISGDVIRGTKRLWVQTEIIKAHLIQAGRGDAKALTRAISFIEMFIEDYLHPKGTWTDQLDAGNHPIAKTIPTSTFYHILCMIIEAHNLSRL